MPARAAEGNVGRVFRERRGIEATGWCRARDVPASPGRSLNSQRMVHDLSRRRKLLRRYANSCTDAADVDAARLSECLQSAAVDAHPHRRR
jgi:hypothetical protein